MHVAIVGPGALGRVYGVRLAARVDVSFVARPSKVEALRAEGPFRIVRVEGSRQDVLETPTLVGALPNEADVALVCVRAEQLDPALLEAFAARPSLPVVVLTPLLPAAYDELTQKLGASVHAAMPGVVAYSRVSEGKLVTRYWLPRVAPTLIDEPRPPDAGVSALVDAMVASGLPTRLELGVHETNPATTVAFVPVAMGLDAAGSADALLADKPLLRLTLEAAKEGLALSARLGRSAAWATTLTRFLGPTTLRIGLGIARRTSPEAVAYAEEHFGHKLHAQNVAMAHDMVELARRRGTPHGALDRLLHRLRGVA